MARKVKVNQEECTGCGVCVDLCPGVFRLNDNDVSEAYNPAGATEAEIQEAIDSCPVECISWED